MTLPVKTARKAVIAAFAKIVDGLVEIEVAYSKQQQAEARTRQDEQSTALCHALRRKPGGRPARYTPDDMAAVAEWLPRIRASTAYREWRMCRNEEGSERGSLRYLLSRIRWRSAGEKPTAEALQKALNRWREKGDKTGR